MEILLQTNLCWLDQVPRQIMKKCSQINLLSKEGQATSVPAQLLTASSSYLNSILTLSPSPCMSSPISISVPSASSFTLKLLAQILCMGETQESGGLEMTMTNIRGLQDVFILLGLNIKLCPKISSTKFAGETGASGCVVKEEVLEPEDHQLINTNSSVAKMSSRGQFRQSSLLKEFKKKMRSKLMEVNGSVEDSCDTLDNVSSDNTHLLKTPDDQADKRSHMNKFGLLQDLSVNLKKCDTDGQNSIIKRFVHKESVRSSMCKICGVRFSKFSSLRRHHHEKHSIQNVKMEVMRKDDYSNQFKCSDCDKTFNHRSSLKKHKESYHEGKTYGCGVCDVICAYRNNMIRHCIAKGHDKNLVYVIVDLP